MTFEELKNANSDIILEEVTWDEVCSLANGASLFFVSVPAGNKPRNERKVRWAGQVMTVGITNGDELFFLRLTGNGRATLGSMTKKEFENGSYGFLFHTRPMPVDDRRNLKPWNEWNRQIGN